MTNWLKPIEFQNWTYVLTSNGEYIRFTDEMKAFNYCNENFPSRILEPFEIKELKSNLIPRLTETDN